MEPSVTFYIKLLSMLIKEVLICFPFLIKIVTISRVGPPISTSLMQIAHPLPCGDNGEHNEEQDRSSTCTRSEFKESSNLNQSKKIKLVLPSFVQVEVGVCGQFLQPGTRPPGIEFILDREDDGILEIFKFNFLFQYSMRG